MPRIERDLSRGKALPEVKWVRRLATVNEQRPLPRGTAARAVARCAVETARLLAQRSTHLPKEHVGTQLCFADGTSGRVFRETTVDRPLPEDPCLLLVGFRLRLLRGRWHALFLWECILNTPLFVGFPGFVSKLWLDRDERGRYRGVYEWDGPNGAHFYAGALWRVLDLACPRGAVHYRVIPGLRRDDVLDNPQLLDAVAPEEQAAEAWWRLVGRA